MLLETVHTDERGTIFALNNIGFFDEITMFETKKGHARGGCVHPNTDEYFCVLSGMIELVLGNADGTDTIKFMKTGDSTTITKNTSHYFYSVIDSLVCEWGPKLEEKNVRDAKYRARVDEINSKVKK